MAPNDIDFGLLKELTYFRGRVGLAAILDGLGIGSGDNVAIQAFTCLAVPEAVWATGATPLYVDAEPETLGMDPIDLLKKLTPRTRAIVVQHTFGIPARMDTLMATAKSHGIPIIEDCCHSFLTKYNGTTVGNFGVASFYSFEWGKPLVLGVGGAVKVNDPLLFNEMRKRYLKYREPPLSARVKSALQIMAYRWIYSPSLYWELRKLYKLSSNLGLSIGSFNQISQTEVSEEFRWRMTPTMRLSLLNTLAHATADAARRATLLRGYEKTFAGSNLKPIPGPAGAETVLVRYPVITERKEKVLAAARKSRIEVASWYDTPVHPVPECKLSEVGYQMGSCPTAEGLCRSLISFPMNVATDLDHVHKIAGVVRSAS